MSLYRFLAPPDLPGTGLGLNEVEVKERLQAQISALTLVLLLLVACGTPQPTPTYTRVQPTLTPAAMVPTALSTAMPTPVPPAETSGTVSSGPTRVLFIGNSLTFVNDLPGMFAQLARSGGYEVEVDMSAHGGWTCADHAASRATLDKIEGRDWDYVILQEQSSLPSLPDQRSELFYPAVRVLESEISASGAQTVLFMTWGRRDGLPEAGYQDYDEMQAQVQAGYVEIASELSAIVAPVGAAWQKGLAQDIPLDLWQFDGVHPSRAGTFLSACVFYATIFQQSPEGLAYRAGLPEETARFLQALAAETVLEDPGRWNVP